MTQDKRKMNQSYFKINPIIIPIAVILSKCIENYLKTYFFQGLSQVSRYSAMMLTTKDKYQDFKRSKIVGKIFPTPRNGTCTLNKDKQIKSI